MADKWLRDVAEGMAKAGYTLGDFNKLAAYIQRKRGLHRTLFAQIGHIQQEYYDLIHYKLPRFTFRQHLRDCFGWLVF